MPPWLDRRLIATLAVLLLGVAMIVASLDRGLDPVIDAPSQGLSGPGADRAEDAPDVGPAAAGGPLPTVADPASVLPADGLAALYADLGLPVPADLVPRDQRPGCQPTDGSEPAVPGEAPTPWSPEVTVPESALPPVGVPPAFTPDASLVAGHGMWIWQYTKTEDQDYRRIVTKAVEAGFDHLWVRVGDSRDGFYAAEYLDGLVPLAHQAGLKVIGWGFPFLHDPVGDTAWTVEALDWLGPHGRGLDGYSPDIERETEGVELSARRVEVHLDGLRAAAGDRPIIATVYPPTDWIMETDYPYERIAAWVDGFATMDYWNCGDSGYRVHQSVERLGHLRPVHVIGQAFRGGRGQPPTVGETLRFLDVAVREGTNGASWWVWQAIGQEQWDAIASFPWHRAVASHDVAPEPAVIPDV